MSDYWNLAIVSLCRDSVWYLEERFRPQIEALSWPGEKRLYVVEGDSKDGTYEALQAWEHERPGLVRLIKHDTGTRRYGSIQHPIRFKALADCCNVAFERIVADDWAGKVWFIDSDYYWMPDIAARLWRHSKAADAIAPYPMAHSRDRGPFFYDTWGWSFAGRPYKLWAPYAPGAPKDEIHPVTSVGGSLMFDAKYLYEGLRMPGVDPSGRESVCLRGMSQLLNQRTTVYGDPTTHIWHLYPWNVDNPTGGSE